MASATATRPFSRWESGATRPSRERLEVFGRALNLSQPEIDGLVSLAGFTVQSNRDNEESDLDAEPPQIDPSQLSAGGLSYQILEHREAAPGSRPFTASFPMLRLSFLSCFIPVVAILAGGYLWSFLGWTALWIPIAYIGLVVAVRLAAGFQRLETDHDLCEFLCVSLFILLTTPLLQTAMLNMDHYGFHSISDWAGTSKPFMLALLVNLGLASMAGAMFFGLEKLRYRAGMRAGGALRRAVSVVLPPIGMVYIVLALLANSAVLVQLGVVFAFLAAIFVVLLLLRDPTVEPQEADRRFLLWSLLVFGTVAATLGGAAILVIYVVPDLPAQFPDYNLLYAWDTDYARLGISPDEVLERFNVGYLWHATAIFVYMVFVVGSKLFASIYRWEPGHAESMVANPYAPGPDGVTDRATIRDRVGSLLSRARSRVRRPGSGSD